MGERPSYGALDFSETGLELGQAAFHRQVDNECSAQGGGFKGHFSNLAAWHLQMAMRSRQIHILLGFDLMQQTCCGVLVGKGRKEGRFTHPWQPARLIGWKSVWVGQCDSSAMTSCQGRKEGRFTHPWQPARLIGWNSVWVGQCDISAMTSCQGRL